ncbi:MAG TPA: glycosyltransferase family 2 protein [Candidatus Solibacter sp.]|nr:glycosyltransferase family 2 protein [Candidatus Solibacter sp.]
MKVSLVMPARNEEGCVADTASRFAQALSGASIDYEIIVVDDGSTDGTSAHVLDLARCVPGIRLVHNPGPNGFGLAVRRGLENITGDAVFIVMADGSDSPEDLLKYHAKLLEGYDCVFGSRFIPGGKVVDYPGHKLIVNRLANWFIKFLFRIPFNDITNAFKGYRREVIQGIAPLIAPHFNLTVEMPLKAIVRGYSFGVVPITWTNRKTGISKLKLQEMGSRYLFIVLYLWLEKHLSRGDYHRAKSVAPQQQAQPQGTRPTHA